MAKKGSSHSNKKTKNGKKTETKSLRSSQPVDSRRINVSPKLLADLIGEVPSNQWPSGQHAWLA